MLRRPESMVGSETGSQRTSCSRTNCACTLRKTDGRRESPKEHMVDRPRNKSTEMSCRFIDGRDGSVYHGINLLSLYELFHI